MKLNSIILPITNNSNGMIPPVSIEPLRILMYTLLTKMNIKVIKLKNFIIAKIVKLKSQYKTQKS